MTIDLQQKIPSQEQPEWNLQGIRWDDKGLVPVVVQDIETKEVIMLAYMNEEALYLTIMEKRAWYYSRSRQQLWRKGETSGHTQEVVEIYFDCDLDAVLLKVNQTGMACHENYYTCFHNQGTTEGFKPIGKINEKPINIGMILEQLTKVIRSRKEERPEGAYTTYLFDKGIDKILKKVGEESAEVIIAAKNNSSEEIRYEVSDLIYHLLVMLEDREVSLTEIAQELLKRRK